MLIPLERQARDPAVNSSCHLVLRPGSRILSIKLQMLVDFFLHPNSGIAFSQHYLCFWSTSQAIVLEIILVLLLEWLVLP